MEDEEIEKTEQKINMNFDILQECEDALKMIYQAEKALNGGK